MNTVIIKRQLTRDMPNRDRIVVDVELGIAPEGQRFTEAGISPGFSATCSIYEARKNASGAARQRMGRDDDGGGADHEAILRAFPKLKPIVDLHLSDPDGVPMHALANGWYWYAPSQGNYEADYHGMSGSGIYRHQLAERNLPDTTEGRMRYCYLVACKLLRCEIPANLDYEAFTAFVEAQRDRWRREAIQATVLLESLPNERTD